MAIFETTYGTIGGQDWICRNHDKWSEDSNDSVLMRIGKQSRMEVFSATKAREIAAALIAAADSFEALKPDPQVEFVKKLESLGLGAVVKNDSSLGLVNFVKLPNGKWSAGYEEFSSDKFSHSRSIILSEGVK